MSNLSLCRAMFQVSTIDAVLVACVTSTLGRYGGGEKACTLLLCIVYCDMACMQYA